MTKNRARYGFAVQIAGVSERWYSHLAPSWHGGVIGDTLYGTPDQEYVDRPGLVEVGDYGWTLEAASAAVTFSPMKIAITTAGREARAGDAMFTLGRKGEAGAGWTAKLIEDLNAVATTVKIDRAAPGGWVYPRLIHIDGETCRTTGFAGTGAPGDEYRFTGLTRGVGDTPAQHHTLESLLPEPTVMEHVAFWTGRRATIFAVELDDTGRAVTEWMEVMHGVMDGPPVPRGTRIEFTIQPLTTLFELALGAAEEAKPFGLAQYVHRFEPGRACTVEVVLQVLFTAAGSANDLYLYRHDIAPEGGGVVDKLWPGSVLQDINATFAAERAAGAPAAVRLVDDGDGLTVEVFDADADVRGGKLWAYSSRSAWPLIGDTLTVAGDFQVPDRARTVFGVDLGRIVDPYPQREGIGLIGNIRAAGRRLPVRHGEWIWSIQQNGTVEGLGQRVRGVTTAHYEHGERWILAEQAVAIPAGGTPTVRVDYYDRGTQNTESTYVRIVESTAVDIDGVGEVHVLQLHDEDVGAVPSFGDFPGLPRTKITPVAVFQERPPAEVMLELLQGGTGQGANGTFDVTPIGLSIPDRWIDLDSFTAYGAPDGASEEFGDEIKRDARLVDTISAMLRGSRTALVMRTGADSRCRIARVPIGPPAPTESVAVFTSADMSIRDPDSNDVDLKTFNRFEAQVSLEGGGELTVSIPDGRGIRRRAGSAATFKIDLRNARPFPDGDIAGQAATRLLPMAGAVFFELGDPRQMWRFSVPRPRLLFVQPCAVLTVTSERLQTIDGGYGVDGELCRLRTATIPMLRPVGSPNALAKVVATHHGANVNGWNASARISAIEPGGVVLTVEDNAFSLPLSPSGAAQVDADGFTGGFDAYVYTPGAEDPRVDGGSGQTVSIESVSGSTITLSAAPAVALNVGDIIVPPVFDDSSPEQRQRAYFADGAGQVDGEPGTVLS